MANFVDSLELLDSWRTGCTLRPISRLQLVKQATVRESRRIAEGHYPRQSVISRDQTWPGGQETPAAEAQARKLALFACGELAGEGNDLRDGGWGALECGITDNRLAWGHRGPPGARILFRVAVGRSIGRRATCRFRRAGYRVCSIANQNHFERTKPWATMSTSTSS